MARQPGGIDLYERRKRVLRILGKLGSAELDDLVRVFAAEAGCTEETLRSAIRHDLDYFAEKSAVEKQYLSPDGRLIEDYSPKAHKKVRVRYRFGEAREIRGSGLLSRLGGTVFIRTADICSDWTIQELSSGNQQSVQLFFITVSGHAVIAIPKNDLPITLLVGRVNDDDPDQILSAAANELGKKRIAAILFRIKTLSSFQNGNRLGHFLLNLDRRGMLEIKDCGSSNGTFVSNISANQVNYLLSLPGTSDATLTDSQDLLKSLQNSGPAEAKKVGKSATRLRAPVRINASSELIVVVT